MIDHRGHFHANPEINRKLYEDSTVYTFTNYRPHNDELLGVAFSSFGRGYSANERIDYDSSRLCRFNYFKQFPFAAFVISPSFPLSGLFKRYGINSDCKKIFFMRYCELLARLGYDFWNPELKFYYRSKRWYVPQNKIRWEKYDVWTMKYILGVIPVFNNVIQISLPDSIKFEVLYY
jgi:hypothetical protein